MKIDFNIPMLNLQLFADGGAGGAAGGTGDGGTAQGQGVTAGAASQQRTGAKSNPLADVKYGIQEAAAPAAEVQNTAEEQPDLNVEFENLIKGKFKEQYDARMQDTIQRRLRGSKETVEKYNSLAPTLEILAKKYGVDVSDIEALNKAIQDDDSYFEDEAIERGMSVKDLKAVRKIERENADLRKQMQERQSKEKVDRLYAEWLRQEKATKQVYPSFDMQAEMQNKSFVDLLKANVDVRTAYEVLHKDEIIPAAMQFAVETAEQKIASKIAANGARPAENGIGAQASALVKSDVSQLSKADRREVQRRVANGEKITFG